MPIIREGGVKESWSRRARRSHPPTTRGFRNGGRRPDPSDSAYLRGDAFEGDLGQPARRRRSSPCPPPARVGDADAEEALEEGNWRHVRESFTRVSSHAHLFTTSLTLASGSWSSGFDAGNGVAGLPTAEKCGSSPALRVTGRHGNASGLRPRLANEDRSLVLCARASNRAPLNKERGAAR